jgi:hypothetical protein
MVYCIKINAQYYSIEKNPKTRENSVNKNLSLNRILSFQRDLSMPSTHNQCNLGGAQLRKILISLVFRNTGVFYLKD